MRLVLSERGEIESLTSKFQKINFIYKSRPLFIMPRGRPKALSAYEKVKAKKIRDFLSANNISRFDSMNNAALLKTIRISDEQVFVSLDHHDEKMNKISQFVSELKRS
jgi:hypothetical protein